MCYKGARGPHGAKNEADLVTYLISEIKGEFAGRPKIECVDTDGNFYVLLDSFAAGQAIEVLGRYLELLKGGA